jgi:UDP-N-acetyl-D-mannosaminuronic acid transferase (WecB/TagA/CpsF family)
MQESGLEWAFRLSQEPGRLWKRYLVDDIPTLWRLSATSLHDGGVRMVRAGAGSVLPRQT